MDQFNDMKVLTSGWKVSGNANFLQLPDLCIKVEGSPRPESHIDMCSSKERYSASHPKIAFQIGLECSWRHITPEV